MEIYIATVTDVYMYNQFQHGMFVLHKYQNEIDKYLSTLVFEYKIVYQSPFEQFVWSTLTIYG